MSAIRGAWPRLLLAGAASAIIALSFLLPLGRSLLHRSATPTEGIGLGFSVQRGDQTLRGRSGDVVFPGDRIRFTYTSDRDAQFALLRANSQRVQVAYPPATTTLQLPAAREAAIELEVELEKRAGAERVFGLFCDAPLALEPVRAALQKADDLPALPGCRVAQLTLQQKLP